MNTLEGLLRFLRDAPSSTPEEIPQPVDSNLCELLRALYRPSYDGHKRKECCDIFFQLKGFYKDACSKIELFHRWVDAIDSTRCYPDLKYILDAMEEYSQWRTRIHATLCTALGDSHRVDKLDELAFASDPQDYERMAVVSTCILFCSKKLDSLRKDDRCQVKMAKRSWFVTWFSTADEDRRCTLIMLLRHEVALDVHLSKYAYTDMQRGIKETIAWFTEMAPFHMAHVDTRASLINQALDDVYRRYKIAPCSNFMSTARAEERNADLHQRLLVLPLLKNEELSRIESNLDAYCKCLDSGDNYKKTSRDSIIINVTSFVPIPISDTTNYDYSYRRDSMAFEDLCIRILEQPPSDDYSWRFYASAELEKRFSYINNARNSHPHQRVSNILLLMQAHNHIMPNVKWLTDYQQDRVNEWMASYLATITTDNFFSPCACCGIPTRIAVEELSCIAALTTLTSENEEQLRNYAALAKIIVARREYDERGDTKAEESIEEDYTELLAHEAEYEDLRFYDDSDDDGDAEQSVLYFDDNDDKKEVGFS